jgi:two-component system response regulator YesN
MSATAKAARFLHRILVGHDTSGELESLLEQAGPGIDPRCLSCIAIRFSPLNKRNSFGEEDYRTIETAAQSIINDIAKSYFRGISFLADSGFCLFVYSPQEDGAKAREMCWVIIQMLHQYLNLAAAAGISSMDDSWKYINHIMIDAIRATEEVFFRGYGIIVYSADIETENPETRSPAVYDWAEPYRQALELRQAEKVKKIFKKLHDILLRDRLSRSEAFNLCFSAAGMTLSVLKKETAEQAFFNENLYETIGVIETLEGLREWIRSFEVKILDFFASLPEKPYEDRIITAAKRYIVENCRRPISLNKAAKDLAISAGYLSSIFKRRTGTGFVEYLTRVKINEAKNLLLSGRYKIYEVSEMVGYEDTGYFTKTFRKATGMTPMEFIRKHI